MPILAKIDDLGRPAWIALILVGFMTWWPIGLATLAFMVGSGRVNLFNNHGLSGWQGYMDQMRRTWWHPARPSGNKAFDDYRAETLRRLEEEQREFQDFLARLRQAKDKAEFDQFMSERRGHSSADL
jgi:Protein of unknown function (DUF2852)